MADHVIDNLGDKLELKQNLQNYLKKKGIFNLRVNSKYNENRIECFYIVITKCMYYK